MLDADMQLLEHSSRWLSAWAQATNRTYREEQGTIALQDMVQIHREIRDVSEFVHDPKARGQYDLLIANAVLDLFELEKIVPLLLDLLRPNGTDWFSINFDGDSIFVPEHVHDGPLLHAYHRSMDARHGHGYAGGDSRTGRKLFRQLTASQATILAAGSSDWVVYGQDGRYPNDEAEFLRCIIQTIHAQLEREADLDRAHVQDWVSARHAQIDGGELVYIAHQLDFVGGLRSAAAYNADQWR